MAKQFTLGKDERLKSRKGIEQLFSEGKKIVLTPYRVLYSIEQASKEPFLLFATGVSAKNFKRAVDRNRIKRLIKEAWRLQKKEVQEKMKAGQTRLTIFFIYTAKEIPAYAEVYTKVGLVLKKLEKLTAP